MRAICLIGVLLLPVAAHAQQELSLLCTNIQGVRVDDDGSRAYEWDKDGITGVVWEFTISPNSKTVSMKLANARSVGGAQHHVARVQLDTGGQMTFSVVLGGAVWTYSLYRRSPTGKVGLLATQHSTTNTDERVSGKMMTGECRII